MSVLLRVFVLCLLTGAVAFGQVPSKPGDWPQWRGPQRDGISQEKGLLKEWPKDGPKLLWQVDSVGVGYSSLAVKDGRVYTLGDLNGVEHTICLSAADGRVLWAVQPEPVAKRLNEQVAAQLKRLDTNTDGTVDEAEAINGLGFNFAKSDSEVVGEAVKVATERTARLLKAFDKDGSGTLTYDEVPKFGGEFARIDAADATADAAALAAKRAAAFVASFDADKDGKVSRKETNGTALANEFGRADQKDQPDPKDAAKKIGDEQLTAAEIEAFYKANEPGRDGVLAAAELQTYYQKRLPGQDGILTLAELRGGIGGLRDGQGDGPRGTPTIDGDNVYVEGGLGDFACLDAVTGKTKWYVSLGTDLGGGRPGWGYSESPLIEGNLVIVTPGGSKGSLAALDKYTGEVIWRSEGMKQAAHYSSPVAADIAGVRQIVQFGRSSVFGVAANSGKFLWEYTSAANGTANCCTPVVFGNYVLSSSAYGTGGGLCEVSTEGDGQKSKEVWFEKKLANHHGGIVKYGDHLYSLGSGTLICMEFVSGKVVWQDRSVGKGSLLLADGMLYLLSEGHQVALAEATPEGYREHGRFKIQAHGRPSWAHPVVAGGKLFLRDQQSLAAYDLRAGS